MIPFNAAMTWSMVGFILGWITLFGCTARLKKTNGGREWWCILISTILGIIAVAISSAVLIVNADKQREAMPKEFPSDKYKLETVVTYHGYHKPDTTYIITMKK